MWYIYPRYPAAGTGDVYPGPNYQPWYIYPPRHPDQFTRPAQASPAPLGCICPPTAEQTCQGFGCPRRSPLGQPSATVEGA